MDRPIWTSSGRPQDVPRIYVSIVSNVSRMSNVSSIMLQTDILHHEKNEKEERVYMLAYMVSFLNMGL